MKVLEEGHGLPGLTKRGEIKYTIFVVVLNATDTGDVLPSGEGRSLVRITQEADYAVRIIYYLAVTGEKSDAKTIAENVGISTRFALKILGKLSQCDFITSFKGAGGGYILAHEPKDITLLQVVTAIDGPIAINKCLMSEETCAHSSSHMFGCPFRRMFDEVSRDIEAALDKITFARFIEESTKVCTGWVEQAEKKAAPKESVKEEESARAGQ